MARAAAEPQIMVALTAFHGAVGKTLIFVSRGDLFAADDPIVKSHPTLFGPATVRRSGVRVESATAGPGELRGA